MLKKMFVDLITREISSRLKLELCRVKNGMLFLGHLVSWNFVPISDLRDF